MATVRTLGGDVAEARRALVVGAGIGGLGAGAALAQSGWTVEVVEVKPQPNVFGVGINQPGNSMRALRALGVDEEIKAAGFEFDHFDFYDAAGNLLTRSFSSLASENGIPNNCGISRPELHQILIGANERAGVELRYADTVGEQADLGDGVDVIFTSGRTGRYDLVVGCDGINSETRARIFGDDFEPRYTGTGVWRVTVPRPPEVTGIGLYQGVDAKAGYIPLSRDWMYLLLTGPEPYRARYEKAELPRMLRHRLEQFGGLAGDLRDAIADGDDVIYGPLHEIRVPPPWFKGRVVLAGDAVHACTPHLTQGAAMALEDAVVLAEELEADRSLADSLTAYGVRRHPRTTFVQDASRAILDGETAVTHENYAEVMEVIRTQTQDRMNSVDAVLAQAA
jgi:2-polyprenyl-6-methoxyphenol hydroxylase-like FAD-dependent oxidoreductase